MDIATNITYWIYLFSITTSLVVSLTNGKKKDLVPIQVYIIVSFLVNGALKVTEILSIEKQFDEAESAIVNIYSILEISILYYYFFKRISRREFHISMRIFLLIYYSACSILWYFEAKGIYYFSPFLFGLEGLLITIPCFFYIYEIFKSDLRIDLRSNSNFIVTCGILFYFGVTIPSYLSWYNLYNVAPEALKITIILNYIFLHSSILLIKQSLYMYSTSAEVILLVFFTVFFSIMITFIVKILFFVQKKQKSFLIDLMEAKTNYERELYKAHLEIQEQTSQEIGREIHDDVGQSLSLAKLGLSTLDLTMTEEANDCIVEISDILEKALDSLRNISRTLNTEIVIKGGLKKSIDMQVGIIQRGGKFQISFLVNGERILFDEKKDIVLFRIVQQALNNIIRHSEATEICITLTYLSSLLKLQIEDNGKGFNLEEKFSGANQVSGIYNMQRRAKLIEAEFDLESKIGSGTRITVTTPY